MASTGSQKSIFGVDISASVRGLPEKLNIARGGTFSPESREKSKNNLAQKSKVVSTGLGFVRSRPCVHTSNHISQPHLVTSVKNLKVTFMEALVDVARGDAREEPNKPSKRTGARKEGTDQLPSRPWAPGASVTAGKDTYGSALQTI